MRSNWMVAMVVLAAVVALPMDVDAKGRPDKVRLELADGRVLTGQVYDLREGFVEVRESRGAVKIAKGAIARWTFVEGTYEGVPPTVVLLKSGHKVTGRVEFSSARGEWVVELSAGNARYPVEEVLRVVQPSGQCSDGAFTPRKGFQKLLEGAIKKLLESSKISRAPEVENVRAFGYFGIPSVEKSVKAGNDVDGELARILHRERLRVLLPDGIEEALPGFLSDIDSGTEHARLTALENAVIEGFDVYGVMGQMLLDDKQPSRVRAYCVEILHSRNRVEDLVQVYQESSGPAQLAVAVALGDLAIYVGIPTLVEALEVDSQAARQLASDKLIEYTGEDYLYDPEISVEDNRTAIAKWEAWYRKNKEHIEATLSYAIYAEDGNPLRKKAQALWQEGFVAWKERKERVVAEKLFERAIEVNPTSLPPYVCLGIMLLEEPVRDLAGAKQMLQRAIKLSPTEGELAMQRLAYYHLGRIYRESMNFEFARQAFRKAVEIDPNYADAWYDLGDALYQDALMAPRDATREDRVNRFREAATAWDKGYENLHEYRKGLVLMGRGAAPTGDNLPFDRRQHNMAMRELKIKLRELEARFCHRLSQVHLALGEREKALRWIELAVASPHPEPGFFEMHGRILSGLGRDEEAAKALEKAKELRGSG